LIKVYEKLNKHKASRLLVELEMSFKKKNLIERNMNASIVNKENA
jgi:hypothetical protein